MKAPNRLASTVLLACFCTASFAQSSKSTASSRALLYADSLNAAFRNNNVDAYMAISYPGIIEYYGGALDFRAFVERNRAIAARANDSAESLQLLQIEEMTSEWQCVVEKSKTAYIDGKKALVVSYMIGQSKDDGNTWKYVDVATNPVDNIAFIMPDIFEALSIPQRQIVFEKQ